MGAVLSMGPKSSKAFSFEHRFVFSDDVEETNALKPIHFRKPMKNLDVIPKDILLTIFASLGTMSILSKVAQVCQLWYSLCYSEDRLWNRFLRNESFVASKLARTMVYEEFLKRSCVCLPLGFKPDVQRGYRFPKLGSAETHYKPKIILLGAERVGKSTMGILFCHGHVRGNIADTYEGECYSTVVVVQGQEVLLEVWDTEIQTQITSLRELGLRYGTSFLILYSVASRDSFNEVIGCLKEIYKQENFPHGSDEKQTPQFRRPIIIVGNNCDLESVRVVSYEEGRALAKGWNVGFIETSAKKGTNVDTAFRSLIELEMMYKMKY